MLEGLSFLSTVNSWRQETTHWVWSVHFSNTNQPIQSPLYQILTYWAIINPGPLARQLGTRPYALEPTKLFKLAVLNLPTVPAYPSEKKPQYRLLLTISASLGGSHGWMCPNL